MQCAKQCLESILLFVFVFKDTNVNICACTEYLQDTHTHKHTPSNDVDWLQEGKTGLLMDRGSRLMFHCIPLEFCVMSILKIVQKTSKVF